MIARPNWNRTQLKTAKDQKEHEAFWQGELGYPQSVVTVCTLFLMGISLHATIGYRLPVLYNPIYWLMALLVPASLIIGRVGRKNRVVHWLTGIPVAVTVTVAVGLLALVGGVVPQSVIQQQFQAESVWSSWPFILLIELMLINLVGSVGKRCWPLNQTNVIYLFTHAGLAISIIGGALSSVMLERHVMVLFPGVPQAQAFRADGSTLPLPFELQLKEFHLKTFAPTLAHVTLDSSKPDGMVITPNSDFVKEGLSTKVGSNNVRVLKYLPQAVYAANGWVAAPWKSAAPAVQVEATLPSGEKKVGWISSGSVDAPQSHLAISDGEAIVMPDPRPKEFRSDVTVKHNGSTRAAQVKVNEPIHIDNWTIYQLSYDSKAGAASAYSTLEVVKDPGLGVVYSGMFLLVFGALLHLWQGVQAPQRGKNQ